MPMLPTILLDSPPHTFESHASNEERHSPLHQACLAGNLDKVVWLLQDVTTEPNTPDSTGNTPFHLACKAGHTSIAHLFLEDRRVEWNRADHHGQTPFFLAVLHGHTALVSLMLQYEDQIEINQPDHLSNTPFAIACQKGHLDIINLLLDSEKAQPSWFQASITPSSGGYTLDLAQYSPFQVACLEGNQEVVQTLLAHPRHQKENLFFPTVDPSYRKKSSPLALASLLGHVNIVSLLLNDPWCYINQLSTTSALHLAVECGHIAVVKRLLLDKRLQVDFKDNEGETPLSRAIKMRKFEIVLLLLKDPRSHFVPSYFNLTALLALARRPEERSKLQSLLKAPHLNRDWINQAGETPLTISCREGDIEMVKFLSCNPHCNVNQANFKGEFPLLIAVKHNRIEIIKQLQSDPELDPNLGAPLCLAASLNLELVELLLQDPRCRVNQLNDQQQSAIAISAEKDMPEIFKRLLKEKEINLNEPSAGEGNTLLAALLDNEKRPFLELLLNHQTFIQDVNSVASLVHRGWLDLLKACINSRSFNPSSFKKNGSHFFPVSKQTLFDMAYLQRHWHICLYLLYHPAHPLNRTPVQETGITSPISILDFLSFALHPESLSPSNAASKIAPQERLEILIAASWARHNLGDNQLKQILQQEFTALTSNRTTSSDTLNPILFQQLSLIRDYLDNPSQTAFSLLQKHYPLHFQTYYLNPIRLLTALQRNEIHLNPIPPPETISNRLGKPIANPTYLCYRYWRILSGLTTSNSSPHELSSLHQELLFMRTVNSTQNWIPRKWLQTLFSYDPADLDQILSPE
jgi:ankyrin repeat protein